jgi:hypothetical protein
MLEVDDVACPVDDMKTMGDCSLSSVELFRGDEIREGVQVFRTFRVRESMVYSIWERVYNADNRAEPTRQENACDLTCARLWHSWPAKKTFRVCSYCSLLL